MVCIVGKTPITIVRDEMWEHSTTKPIHIAELRSVLHEWVSGKDNTLRLDILTEVAKAQIKRRKDIRTKLGCYEERTRYLSLYTTNNIQVWEKNMTIEFGSNRVGFYNETIKVLNEKKLRRLSNHKFL